MINRQFTLIWFLSSVFAICLCSCSSVAEPTPTPRHTPTPIPLPTSTLPKELWEESRVWIDSNTYIAGADGGPLVIVNNPNAKDPTWSQLVDFLRQDPTDNQQYQYGYFVCADFAEMLHNNAEEAGWRAAYVSIELADSLDGHALNAFQTTDRGLVYIDCTGTPTQKRNGDKIVNMKIGEEYVPKSIHDILRSTLRWDSMGRVTEINSLQW